MTWQHDPEIAVALDLVGKAYEAAAEPELWPQFLNALADATDCDGTIIWLHDAQDESALLRVAGASFVRHVPFGDKDLHLTQLLMSHLRRACLLHQRLTSLRAERSSALAALELLPTAVWLLDSEGRLLFANRAGRELDARRDGLWIARDGKPTADDADERQAMQRCITRAIAAGQGFGLNSDGALRIRRSRTADPLHAMVYPLARDALLAGGAAAVFIFDPAKTAVPDIELLKVFYGLTPAEARLACALAQGSTVAEYSATHRLTSNTVRTHLKRALSKTGVHQQSQLVRLVANMPAPRPPQSH